MSLLEGRINRRGFVRSVAGCGAVARLANNAMGAGTGMFVALNTSLTGGKVQWPEFARLAARVGYGGVDLNLGAAMKEGVDATRALLADLKLRLSFCNLPGAPTRDEDAFRKGMDVLEDAAKFASAVGCDRMMVVMPPSSQVPKDELRKTLKDRFTAIGEILDRQKIRLGFEFLGPLQLRTRAPHEFIWRMNEMVDFAKECGPNFGVVLDSWHWHHSGGTVDDIVRAGKSRIVTIHVSDAAKMPPEDVRDNQRLMPGDGVIDLTGFFKALRAIGYEDGVSPEPLGRVPKEMSAEEGARLGLETTLAVMRKAGAIA
ncbi:MAG TPA: sugar phosphate isomerase/epimerase family protein [Bryobacteraceae bacterium]|nr:sugar phosphate isomerase/epimerase family protein [Bryobacteraceae bacterium]